jgi:mRNA interferase MazF
MTIKQSEIWLVNLDPTIGAEISKTRPCLVVSDDTIGRLKSKTVLPVTGWSDMYHHIPWMVKCDPNEENHLTKASAIDTFQIRNVSAKRFLRRIGAIDDALLFKVHSAVTKTLDIRYRLIIE